MKLFFTLIIGLLVGVGDYWYLTQPKTQSAAVNASETTSDVGERLKNSFDREKIKEELSQTGKVIREKARQAGHAISDATANARITASIKTKLVEDSGLSALKIDVDANDGVVTLSGNVSSHEQIVKAMDLAWETEGVHKVVSTVQVKPAQ